MTHRTTAACALIAVGALSPWPRCGVVKLGLKLRRNRRRAAPRCTANLVIARTADSQSMNNTTVFDNESIWIFEQIMQPLYTVTPNGKGVQPWLATGYTVSANKKTYTFTLRKGVKFSNGKPMTSADVKFSIDQASAAAKGWGYINMAIKSVAAPTPHRGGQPQVPVGAAARRPVAVLQRDRPGQLRRPDRDAVLPRPDRYRPVQVGLLAQGLALKLVRNPTSGSRASPTWTASPGPTCPATTPGSCSSRAGRPRWTSSRPGPR